MKSNLTLSARRFSALLAGTAVAATAPSVEAQDWTKHFRIGLQLAVNIDAEFSMGGNFTIPGANPGPAGVRGRDHFYDDGYVLVDDNNNAGGLTSYWGYQNADQYDAGDEDLLFHSTQSFSMADSTTSLDDIPYIGMELAYGGSITRWGQALLGWEVGYSFLPISITDSRALGGRFVRTRFLHNAFDIVIPDAPYEGGPSGQGPGIDDLANQIDDQIIPGTLEGSRTLDISLHTLRLGPTLHWELARRWAVEASAGGAFGLATGEYKFNETGRFADGSTTPIRGKISHSDAVYGGYATGVLLFHVEEHGDLYAGVQFMSLSNTEVSEGGRSARLNLGAAFSLLVGINWPF